MSQEKNLHLGSAQYFHIVWFEDCACRTLELQYVSWLGRVDTVLGQFPGDSICLFAVELYVLDQSPEVDILSQMISLRYEEKVDVTNPSVGG